MRASNAPGLRARAGVHVHAHPPARARLPARVQPCTGGGTLPVRRSSMAAGLNHSKVSM